MTATDVAKDRQPSAPMWPEYLVQLESWPKRRTTLIVDGKLRAPGGVDLRVLIFGPLRRILGAGLTQLRTVHVDSHLLH